MARGAPPESLLVLCYSTAAADALRARLEDRLEGAYEELTVTTFHGFCARLLRDEALEAGLDPFVTPVSAADRLAMLLERIDDLPLRHHDLRGNPSATLGAIVQRIDRLKDELVSAADYAAWAAALPEDRAREREFADLYAAHERMLEEAGTLDVGDLVLHSFRLLRAKAHVRARLAKRHRHVLVDELQDASFAQGLLLRLLAAGAAAQSPRSPTTTRRSTASAAPRPRTSTTSAPSGRRRRWCGSRPRSARASGSSRRPARSSPPRPIGSRRRCTARPAARSRSGAAPPSARRRRRSPPRSSG